MYQGTLGLAFTLECTRKHSELSTEILILKEHLGSSCEELRALPCVCCVAPCTIAGRCSAGGRLNSACISSGSTRGIRCVRSDKCTCSLISCLPKPRRLQSASPGFTRRLISSKRLLEILRGVAICTGVGAFVTLRPTFARHVPLVKSAPFKRLIASSMPSTRINPVYLQLTVVARPTSYSFNASMR
eukprot:265336-Prorocentrum_minimum.AAC.5